MRNNDEDVNNNLFLDAVYRAIDKKIANSRKKQTDQINIATKNYEVKADLSEISKPNDSEESKIPILEFYKMGAFRTIPSIFTIDRKDDITDKNSYIDNSDNKVHTKVLHQ